jgi:hypothetical protein
VGSDRGIVAAFRKEHGGDRVSPIDRFTRDERSAAVWWPLALLAIVLCIATIPGGHRAVDAGRSDAETRSVTYLQGVLASSIGSADLAAPLTGSALDAARSALRRDVLGDTRVNAVRLWTSEGTLLFSSLPGDPIGSGEALNDAQIREAAADQGAPMSVVSARTLAGTPGATTFHTYLGLVGTTRPVVGEVELSDAALLSSIHGAWLGYRIIFGIAALLLLGLALLSMREPAAKIGAGVPFYPTSVPVGFALVDQDEQAQLQQTGAHARSRVAHIEEKLRESEEARRTAEGQLQRALSAIATRMRTTGVEPVLPRAAALQPAAAPPPPAPAAPAVIEPPPTRKPARPKVTPAPAPVVAASPAPERVVGAPEPEPVSVPEPEPVVVPEREPVMEVEPEFAMEPERELAMEPESKAPVPSEPVLQLPEIDRGFVLRVPDVPGGHDDESAVDVLERLVEPVPGPTSGVDPSVVRARLTRLAASKKPGPRSDEPLGTRRGSDS